jgi:hypothetical protein
VTAALDLLAAGASLRAVARHYGVSHETLRRAVRDAGIPFPTACRQSGNSRDAIGRTSYGPGLSRALLPDEVTVVRVRPTGGERMRSGPHERCVLRDDPSDLDPGHSHKRA